jgi:hypothetical protein
MIKYYAALILIAILGEANAQNCSDLFISEYVEGTGSNKALELYNPTGTSINLSSYSILIYANGATTPNVPINLSGTIAGNGTHVIANTAALSALTSLSDQTSASLSFNGNDAVVLLKNTDTLDIFGKIGEDPGGSWTVNNVSTVNKTLIRNSTVQLGVLLTPSVFDPSIEWTQNAEDDFSNLGSHTSSCLPSNSGAGTCGSPIVLSCGSVYSGNTTGFANNLGNYSCTFIDKIGPEVIHSIISPANGSLTVTLTRQSGEDLEVGILSSCDEAGCLDITSAGFGATVSANIPDAVAGQTYYIVVDGDEPSDFGTYSLEVECPMGTCENPIPLSCGDSYDGNNEAGVSNFNVYGCASQQEEGKEVVHTFSINDTSDITIALTGLNGADLDIHLLSDCHQDSCISRNDNLITQNSLPPGNYFIVVDAFGSSTTAGEGTYTLDLTCSLSEPTVSGSCSSPIPLSCGVDYNGNSTGFFNTISDYSCSIYDNIGPDVIHTIVSPANGELKVNFTRPSGMDMEVAILSDCSGDSCLDKTVFSIGSTISASIPDAVAGQTYYIIVDGDEPSDFGAYTLNVECPEGSCANPVQLTCGDPYSSTTVGAQSIYGLYSCGAQQEEGSEMIHSFTITDTTDISIALTGLNGADLDLHLLTDCDPDSCFARGDNFIMETGVLPGTYYVVVDGFGDGQTAQDGEYTIEVTCIETETNVQGSCFTPIQLSCGVPYTNNTAGYSNTISDYSCSTFENIGPDVIHTIVAPTNGALTVNLTRPSGEDMEVAILSACNGMTCLDKTVFSIGSTISASIPDAVAGQTYFIVVDGDTPNDSGEYTLEVECPQGSCSSPIELSCGVAYDGTTDDGESNYGIYSCNGTQYDNKEKVHVITIADTSDLSISLTGLGSVNLDVILLSSCHEDSCIASGDNNINATLLPAGDYYLIVDGVGSPGTQEGDYTIEVNCVLTGVNPIGSCNNPVEVSCGQDYSGSTSGQTNLISDYDCSTFDNIGPDVIHVFTANTSGELTATLTRPSGMDMEVAILSACNGDSCLDKTVFSIGASISASISDAVAGQVYYIVVDGDEPNDFGNYSLAVSLVFDTTITESICQGESFVFGNQTLTSTGDYDEVFSTQSGCDSTVSLELTVNATPIVTVSIDGDALSSSPGSAHQWFLNGDSIPGAIYQNYTPTVNGNYTVSTVAFNGCENSGGYVLNNVSVLENEKLLVSIYPNPSKGVFNLESSSTVNFKVFNLLGELIMQEADLQYTQSIDLSDREAGVYVLRLTTQDGIEVVKRLVKE